MTGDLREADLRVLGRIASASNATLLCELADSGTRCVYKPVRGEVPLWDFPDGTLAGREVASYLVSEALGWGVVPPTVLRDGPVGPGMVQLWIDDPEECADDSEDSEADAGATAPAEHDPVDMFDVGDVPDGYLPIVTGLVEDRDEADGYREVVLAHADDPRLMRMAVLDVLINNADRKGGHVLAGPGGRLYGVDHGICLHREPKLRTVLWGWAGRTAPDELVVPVASLAERIDVDELGALITPLEVETLLTRAADFADDPVMPMPSTSRPIPWPPF
ncbi:SCO1664 family protein [Tsukamurella sp. 8F]|uniref:SCO1664 family protein n=1 Tax=unclassified Tsukamurella TaxID=2633480 RepID=UPI0023B8FEBC|nr:MULTISPECIES: SCO1664 family protein [unclassified Tsukamurella]MDF0530523.1 SCO1664 family protein [Tsukamurella sp. 8J]MDF0586827.1 SCO1664 family protein [Tsukamurella sp. 8F]